jgi:hypothetical protein
MVKMAAMAAMATVAVNRATSHEIFRRPVVVTVAMGVMVVMGAMAAL